MDLPNVDQDLVNEVENARRNHELNLEIRRSKLETIRLAKETLLENARSKPIDSRDVTAEDIKSFAQVLVSYINE